MVLVESRKELIKSEDLWFDDGNVILAVKDTLFKVYRGVLAKASPVFHDMFTMPQPPDAEIMDGCPLIRLEDAVEDMENFLKVLFNGLLCVYPSPSQRPTI